jgi:hypothetical protein
MGELPQGRIEVTRGHKRYALWLTPETHEVLRLYAQDENTSITDVGNRILLGFLTEVYDFETPREVRRGALKAIFPNPKAFYDAIVLTLNKKRAHERPVFLRRRGKLRRTTTKPDSSDQDNP